MLTVRIIPCLDVQDGRVVKGVRFSNLRDAGDPAACAGRYQAQGADELVLLDVSATLESRQACLATVESVRELLGVPLTVGGGLRNTDHAQAFLAAGADKVALNTAAVETPSLLQTLAGRFGSQCVVLAMDVVQVGSQKWEVVVRSGRQRTGLDPLVWAVRAAALGAGEILLTSWDRDGTRSGYDLELIGAMRAAVNLPLIASGGANGAAHMESALKAGADAVLAASIFHQGQQTPQRLKQRLAADGFLVRP